MCTFLILYAHFFLNPLCFIYQSILFHPLVNQYILFPMHTHTSKIFNSENQVILTLLLHKKIKTASFKKFHLLPWFFRSRMEFFDSLYLLRHSFYFFKMLVVPCTPIFLTSVCQRSIIVFSSWNSRTFRYHVEREIPNCLAPSLADSFPDFASW